MKFTVLIPTRDRAETLVYALASVCNQDYDELTIIVSDNKSTDHTREVVAAARDPRIQYISTDRRLSMTGNFEFSLAQVREGFVLHLGDDDGLLPDSIAGIRDIAAETGVKAIRSGFATYHWPNVHDQKRRNELLFEARPGFKFEKSASVLRKVVDFRSSYTTLPSTYNSFIHRSVIDKAIRDGRYYHSRTPDSYSGVVNAAVMEKFVTTGMPFLLGAVSSRSNGAAQWASSNRQEAEMYEQENDIAFHPDLTFAPSLEIILAEAFLQARDKLPELAEIDLDYRRMSNVALREATAVTWSAVTSAIDEIGRKSGYSAPRSASRPAKSPGLQMLATANRLSRGIRRLRQNVHMIDASEFGVADVHAAAALVRIIGRYVTMGYALPGASLRRWLKRI